MTITLYTQGFQKKLGTGFTFCLALNAGVQKKTVESYCFEYRKKSDAQDWEDKFSGNENIF